MEMLPTIFEPFRRREGTRGTRNNSEGLGLGLFIVRELIRAYSGQIRVQSCEVEGTTFVLTLPQTDHPSIPGGSASLGGDSTVRIQSRAESTGKIPPIALVFFLCPGMRGMSSKHATSVHRVR